MKTITVWQPWAGALAAGIKENETRSWATKYRGPIAIHAAMREVFDGLALIPVPIALKIKEALRCEWDEMPRGAIIATGELVDCISEGRGGAPVFKLVAADGGLWKSQAVDNVKRYLIEKLVAIPNREQLTIIA